MKTEQGNRNRNQVIYFIQNILFFFSIQEKKIFHNDETINFVRWHSNLIHSLENTHKHKHSFKHSKQVFPSNILLVLTFLIILIRCLFNIIYSLILISQDLYKCVCVCVCMF